ncbi:MAG: MFS transporter [Candidatus Adiutrix sp.]|nr:MFS transporter [Candidatus Adiutrix sp.]
MPETKAPLEADRAAKVRPRAILVMAIAALAYVVAALERISPPVVALDIRTSLNLGPDDLSLMFSATFITYALMQPLAGFGADRFGPKRCLMMSAALLGAASIWFSQSSSFWSAALARALVGMAAGFAFVPAVRLAANWLPDRYFGLASSCILAASALSNFLAGSPLALTAAHFGWRWSFLMLGLVALGLWLLVWRLISDRPSTVKIGRKNSEAPPGRGLGFLAAAKITLGQPIFWLISLVYSGTDLLYDTFTGLWAGPFLMEVYGLSSVSAGNMLSTAAIGFLAGGPLMVLLGDRWGSYSRVIICLALGNVGITAFIIWGPDEAAPWMLYLLCLLAPMGVHGTGLLFAIGRGFFPENVTGTVIGFLNLMPFMFGAIMQNIIGLILAGAQTDPAYRNLSVHAHYGQAFKPVLFWAILTVGAAIWLHRKNAAKP